jgi:RNA recognition motif-containing protein
MPRKLYVGNLDKHVSPEELELFFKDYGPVYNVTILKDEDTGQSLGYGFVELDAEKANDAKKTLSGQSLRELPVVINNARMRRISSGRDQRPSGKRKHSW